MKIVVIGTRGIPNIPGGVETHCEELYPRIVAMGHEVTIIRRSCYVKGDNRVSEYKGVKLIDVYAPRKKSLEAVVHTFLAVLRARRLNPDVLHVHAVGPSMMIPLARLLGMRVVSTNHGPDYDRQKWGWLAKSMLKFGERMGAIFSNRVVVISQTIKNILRYKYGRIDTNLIYNGVIRPEATERTDYIESLGLKPKRYILTVGRFVPEKGYDDLIDAYVHAMPKDYDLVLAGDADHEDGYSLAIKAKARSHNVKLTGFIKGEKLNQVLTNAALFVLPSYHEGLPIALLEALSYNLDVIVSDIPANRLDCLVKNDFFHCGDVEELAKRIKDKLANGPKTRQYNLAAYNWDNIARQTVEVYESVKH